MTANRVRRGGTFLMRRECGPAGGRNVPGGAVLALGTAAERAVRAMYMASGLFPPERIHWMPSPLHGLLSIPLPDDPDGVAVICPDVER